VSCELSRNRRRITCKLRSTRSTSARLKGTVRLAGSRLKATKTGRNGTVRITLRSQRRVSRSRKVIVKAAIRGSSVRMSLPLGRDRRVALKNRD
jgi:hypothetical protein